MSNVNSRKSLSETSLIKFDLVRTNLQYIRCVKLLYCTNLKQSAFFFLACTPISWPVQSVCTASGSLGAVHKETDRQCCACSGAGMNQMQLYVRPGPRCIGARRLRAGMMVVLYADATSCGYYTVRPFVSAIYHPRLSGRTELGRDVRVRSQKVCIDLIV